MVDAGQTLRGGIYGRLSLAIMGDTTKVDDQISIGHRLLSNYRRPVRIDEAHIFRDDSKSAWRRNRRRLGWDGLLEVAPLLNILAIYHGDRLVRQPRDMEDLLDIGKQTGLILLAPTAEYNLADPDHQMMLRWMVARAANEVDHLSRRMKDGHRRRREQGKVRSGGRGGRPFGFEPDQITPRRAEILLCREAADRLLNGEGASLIARDWNTRGLVTVTGGQWTHGTIKKMMLRPRMAGLMPDGETRAAWAPVLDDDPDAARGKWEAVCAVLNDRATSFTHYVTNARTHLLSGIPTCGPCEQPLSIRHNTRGRQLTGYGCITPGCRRTHRAQEYLDEYVVGHVLELLADERVISELETPDDPGLASQIAELEQRKAVAEQQLVKLVDNPHVRPELLAASLAEFDTRIAELRGQVAVSARRRLLLQHAGLRREQWDDLPLQTRRALVVACYRIVVWPVAKKGPGFDPNTIELIPVQDR